MSIHISEKSLPNVLDEVQFSKDNRYRAVHWLKIRVCREGGFRIFSI